MMKATRGNGRWWVVCLLVLGGCSNGHGTLCEALEACDHLSDVEECVADLDEANAEYDCSDIVEAGLDEADAAMEGDCGGIDNWVSVFEDYGPYCVP